MKAILEFDMNDVDEKMEHFRCVKSLDMALCLHTIDEMLRSYDKYGSDQIPPEAARFIREKFWEKLEEYGIILDDLTR